MRLFLAALSMVLVLVTTAGASDLRAPDQQVAPPQQPAVTTDLRAPDQRAPAAAPSPVAPPIADDGPTAMVFMLIGLGAALLLVAGAYVATRYRHRTAIADDLVVE